jgi:adenine-specific DNA-methyltransferase
MKKPGRNPMLTSESQLITAALSLGADTVPEWSSSERELARNCRAAFDTATADWFRRQIRAGNDPLGDTFCALRSPEERRPSGAVYTPSAIIQPMIAWASARDTVPQRVIDPGVGSARFLLAAGKAFPHAALLGFDTDPLATGIARANLAVRGMGKRSQICLADYCSAVIAKPAGRTLFIGNPPYVRHHGVDRDAKTWLTREAARLGYSASQLSGLHVHFFLATLMHAQPGDWVCLVTAAEWLDVNYGKLVRDLFLRDLGGLGLTLVEPAAAPFGETAATAVISTFEVGSRARSFVVKRASDTTHIAPLEKGRSVPRSVLEGLPRWSRSTATQERTPDGYVQLGDLFRVHRGQVTGANDIWIANEQSRHLPPEVLYRAVTRAKELFAAEGVLTDVSALRQVIDLPTDLSVFDGAERKAIDEFLRLAKRAGVDAGYIASRRKPWWTVGLREPAPILATYMARRPPAFVRNRGGARHINVAHGLYPLQPLPEKVLVSVVKFLNGGTKLSSGRTYAGGLTKFEPREMERIPVPSPELLVQRLA